MKGRKIEKKVKDHDSIMETHANTITDMEGKVADLDTKIREQGDINKSKSKRIDGLAESSSKARENLQQEILEMKQKLSEQNAAIQRLKNGQNVATAQNMETRNVPFRDPPRDFVYTQDTPDPRLNIIIEGLHETEGEDLMKEITEVCEKMDVKINPNEIVQAWRLPRKVPLLNKPNPVKICFRHYNAKERIMRSKYKLKKQMGTEHVWLNHDEPTVVRRAKGRARHIASYSRRKGSNAQVTSSGIVLDNVFYTYENLDKVPSIYIPPDTTQYPLQYPNQQSTMGRPPSIGTGVVGDIPTAMNRDHSTDRRQTESTPTPRAPKSRETNRQSPKNPRTKKNTKNEIDEIWLSIQRPICNILPSIQSNVHNR